MERLDPKYAGKYIATVNKKVVASGKSQLQIYRQAKKLHPKKIVTLIYVPTKKETSLFI